MTDWLNKTHTGDCRELLAAMAADGVRAQTCITSPPYFGLRDYGMARAGAAVLDPFMGSGTTARVAQSLGRQFIGCELNPAYVAIQQKIGIQAGMAL